MPSPTPATLNTTVAEVTQRIRERSRQRRALYEAHMADQHKQGVHRGELSCETWRTALPVVTYLPIKAASS